jgi:hypothetical protein
MFAFCAGCVSYRLKLGYRLSYDLRRRARLEPSKCRAISEVWTSPGRPHSASGAARLYSGERLYMDLFNGAPSPILIALDRSNNRALGFAKVFPGLPIFLSHDCIQRRRRFRKSANKPMNRPSLNTPHILWFWMWNLVKMQTGSGHYVSITK